MEAGPLEKRITGLSLRYYVDELAEPATIAKFNCARDLGKERVVFTQAHVLARLIARAPLPDNNRASANRLPGENLNAQPLRIGIAAVFRAS